MPPRPGEAAVQTPEEQNCEAKAPEMDCRYIYWERDVRAEEEAEDNRSGPCPKH